MESNVLVGFFHLIDKRTYNDINNEIKENNISKILLLESSNDFKEFELICIDDRRKILEALFKDVEIVTKKEEVENSSFFGNEFYRKYFSDLNFIKFNDITNTKKIVQKLYKNKNTITYGTFDFMHKGHKLLLSRLNDYNKNLIVIVSSDSFNKIKGKKSYQNELTRFRNVFFDDCVYLVSFENKWEQKKEDIKKYNVGFFVMGNDWKGKFDWLSEYCDVRYLERTKNISSTLLKKDFTERDYIFKKQEAKEILNYFLSKLILFLKENISIVSVIEDKNKWNFKIIIDNKKSYELFNLKREFDIPKILADIYEKNNKEHVIKLNEMKVVNSNGKINTIIPKLIIVNYDKEN